MRKYLLFTLFLCLHWSAWGQAPYEYRYWFDGDEKNQKTGKSGGASWHIDADVSQLSNTLHAVHFQVKDKNSVWSAPTTRYFLKTPDKQLNYRYWMDGDLSTMKSGVCNNQPMMIDVAGLSDGFHVLYAQVGNGDVESSAQMRMFIKIPQTEGVKNLKCVCSIDGKIYKQEFVPSSGGLVDWAFDVSSLDQGLHTLHIQVLTNSGAATNVYKGFFLRVVTNKELADMKCVYSIDGGKSMAKAGVFTDGMFHFNLDVDSVEDGLHRLTYFLSNENGTTTKVSNAFFFKTPLNGSGIVSYKYWLNDDIKNAVTVNLKERKDPLQLISLLPVDKHEIRSSCFQFEFSENGEPIVYAKNDVYFQFIDVSGKLAQLHRQYVDENVSMDVKSEHIEPCVEKNIGKIAENNIKWYDLSASVGDSLVFKANNPCSMELFSPSGKKVWSRTGGESTIKSGTHAKEDGIHYLAVHDCVNKNDILLDYTLIDRYCVLEHTPTSSAKSDMLVMRFVGNGFENLKRIELLNEDTVLNSFSLKINDYSSAECKFNLSQYPRYNEKFDIKLSFGSEAGGSVIVKGGFVLQEIRKGDIKIEVLPSYRVGSPRDVDIRITNTGNVPYWGVPFNIGLDNTSAGAMEFKNFTPFIADEFEDSSQTSFFVDNFLGSGNSGWYFPMILPYIGAEEEIVLTVGIFTRVNLYAWVGEPWSEVFQKYTSLNYRFVDYLNPKLNYITAGQLCLQNLLQMADSISAKSTSSKLTVKRFAPDRELEDAIENMEDANELICDLAEDRIQNNLRRAFGDGVAEALGELGGDNAARGLAEANANVAEATGMAIGGTINGLRLRNSDPSLYGIDPSDPTFSSLYEYRDNLRRNMPHPRSIIATALGMDDFMEFDEMCGQNSNPRPDAHGLNILRPADPNDIYGYKSESGTEYIGIDVERLPYCIEFENTPELANAPANLIVVDDVLDPNVFDLSTFNPTTVTFGKYEVDVKGVQDFVGTVDMRPEVNAIAEVRLTLDKNNGNMRCIIKSLDPMTLEHTTYYKDGVLPVNYDGKEGIGTIRFTIALKKNVQDGTNVDNSASIVFGNNEAIKTPIWHNVTDFVRPVSYVSDITILSQDEIDLSFTGYDGRSGIWRYDLFCSKDSCKTWECVATNLETPEYIMKVDDKADYRFACIATDFAGNREQKELKTEFSYHDGVIVSDIRDLQKDDASLDNDIYNLMGQKVIGSLKPGIYVRKGKTFIVTNTKRIINR